MLATEQDSSQTAAEFLRSQADKLLSVIGYNTVPGYHQLSLLHTGDVLNTSDSSVNQTGSAPSYLTVAYGGGNTAKVMAQSCPA